MAVPPLQLTFGKMPLEVVQLLGPPLAAERSAPWASGVVQGLGNVGNYLCKELHAAGARLIVTDIRHEKVQFAVKEYGAEPTTDSEVYAREADIFAPCALENQVGEARIG